jgi:hypothetical protein
MPWAVRDRKVFRMRDNSSHSSYGVNIGQIHHQPALGSFRWFTVKTTWVMFISSMAIAWNSWSRASVQRVARHFAVFLMRLLLAIRWRPGTPRALNLSIGLYKDSTEWPLAYVGILCARGIFTAIPAGLSFGLDDLHGVRLFHWVPGKGPCAPALALAS